MHVCVCVFGNMLFCFNAYEKKIIQWKVSTLDMQCCSHIGGIFGLCEEEILKIEVEYVHATTWKPEELGET